MKTPSLHSRLSPAGLPASALTALLAASGTFAGNVMPVVVTGVQTALHFTPREAGLVASVNSYGTAVGALIAVAFSQRLPWRRTAAIGLAAMAVLDLVSTICPTLHPLLVVRALQGCIGGTVTALTFTVIARAAVPDRIFGLLMLVQFLLGSLGIAVLPRLVESHGVALLFEVLASYAVLLLLPIIPDQPLKAPASTGPISASTGSATTQSNRTRALCAFAALFVFQVSHSTGGAFILDIARTAGLTTSVASAIVGIGGMSGIAGALLVVAIGLRYGRLHPLMIAMTLGICSSLILLGNLNVVGFLTSAVIGSVCSTFSLAMLFGLCSSVGKTGRGAVLTSFVSKLGFATGPLIGGFVFSIGSIQLLIAVGSALALVACLAAWVAARPSRGETSPQVSFAGMPAGADS